MQRRYLLNSVSTWFLRWALRSGGGVATTVLLQDLIQRQYREGRRYQQAIIRQLAADGNEVNTNQSNGSQETCPARLVKTALIPSDAMNDRGDLQTVIDLVMRQEQHRKERVTRRAKERRRGEKESRRRSDEQLREAIRMLA